MPISAKCPTCEHSYNVPDGQRGKRVRCRNCADIFVVGGGKDRGRDEDDAAEVNLADEEESSTPRKKKRSSEGGADLRSRLDREDLKPREKRRNPDHDDEDEDDDDDDRPRRKKSGEGSVVPLLLGIGGVILLMLVGGAFAVYWSMSRVVQAGEDLAQKARQDFLRNNPGNNVVFNPPPPPVFNPPIPAGPQKRGAFDQPKNIDEALEDINEQFNDVFVPKARAEWLTNQAIEEGRRKEVCDALWNLSQNNPHHFTKEAGTNGFIKWAGPAQGDNLLKLVEAGHGGAMEAAVKLKLPNTAAALCKKLTDWGSRGHVVRHLEQLGPPQAEKEVLKFLNNKDGGLRNDVNRMLKKWGTKSDVIVDQCIVDLANTDQEVVRAALERIAEQPTEGSTRQAAVIKAVRPLMASTQQNVAQGAVQVALTWGNADLAPDFIAALETPGHVYDRNKLMEALTRFNTEDCRKAIVRQLTNPSNRFQASQAIRNGGAAFEPALLEYLVATTDPLQRMEAMRLLGDVGTLKSLPALNQIATDPRNRLWAGQAALKIQQRAKGGVK